MVCEVESGLLSVRSETSLQGRQQRLSEPLLPNQARPASETWSESGEDRFLVGAGSRISLRREPARQGEH